MQLVKYHQDGIEIYIDTNTGESFASAKGYSRMSEVGYDTIKKRLQRLPLYGGHRGAELPTDKGIRWGTLVTEDLMSEWIIKDNPEIAAKLIRLGVRAFLHTLAGYKVTTTAVAEAPPLPPLPPADVRVKDLAIALEKFGVDLSNPRYSQALQDYSLDLLGVNPKSSPENAERWLGVVELAEQMGYNEAKQLNVRSALGRFVSSKGGASLTRRKESRLCNGTQRDCWLYLDTPQLRKLVDRYFLA